jgi:hypothetical protein
MDVWETKRRKHGLFSWIIETVDRKYSKILPPPNIWHRYFWLVTKRKVVSWKPRRVLEIDIKRDIKKTGWKGMDIWLRRGRGQSTHRNEPSYSVKFARYLDKLRHHKLPEKKSAPLNKLHVFSLTQHTFILTQLVTVTCALHVPACTYIRSKKEWKSVLPNKIMALVHITQTSRCLSMQLRVTKFRTLRKYVWYQSVCIVRWWWYLF